MNYQEVLDEVPWRELAACNTEGAFFPQDDDIGAINAAKAVCSSCPVNFECLTYAVDTNQPDGIWGGMTLRERRRLRRQWAEEEKRAS